MPPKQRTEIAMSRTLPSVDDGRISTGPLIAQREPQMAEITGRMSVESGCEP
jgi:hypothetical protein